MKNCAGSISAAWLVAATLVACSHEAAPPTSPSAAASAPIASASPAGPAAPGSAAPEMAPTPYSSDELRAGNRAGTLYRYKVETSGQPVQIKVMEFMSGTSAESAEVKNVVFDETGQTKSPAKVDRASWDDLRRHAEFPRAALTVEPGSIEVPAGKFEAMVYTVNAPSGETMRFYFAKSFAGPPVLFYKERAGIRLTTSTLIERKSGG